MAYKKLPRDIFIALVLGAGVGLYLPSFAPYVSWMGLIFKLSLAMIVMPIILTSLLQGMRSLGDVRRLGDLGVKTLVYYLGTTFLAIVVGLFLVTTIQPGVKPAPPYMQKAIAKMEILDAQQAPELLANAMFQLDKISEPQREDLKASLTDLLVRGKTTEELKQASLNMWGALALRQKLKDKPQNGVASMNVKEFLTAQISKAIINPFEALAEKHILAVIVFTILIGAALSMGGAASTVVFQLNEAIYLALLKIIDWILRFAPLGVFGLLVDVVSSSGPGIFRGLGLYAVCVVLGLGIHAFVTIPTLLYFVSGMLPTTFFRGIKSALAVAFSTSSSSATLPLTMRSVEDNLGVDKKISGFVLPLGATVNMDGTALYEAVAAVFIAQLYGISLGFSSQVLIALTAALAAIGAAGIPAAGTVTMALVLSAVGLPLEGIGLLLAIDRPLDMCRTAVNVTGDAAGTLILSKWAKA